MIQRIQTLLLAGIIVLVGFFLNSEIVKTSNEKGTMIIDAYHKSIQLKNGTIENSSVYVFAGIGMLLAGVVIFNIMQYNNRKKQLVISLITTALCITWLVTIMIMSYNAVQDFGGNPEWKRGLYIPVACMLLNTMASRFIRRDERKVNDADRLR